MVIPAVCFWPDWTVFKSKRTEGIEQGSKFLGARQIPRKTNQVSELARANFVDEAHHVI